MVVRDVNQLAIYDQTFHYTNDDFAAGMMVSVECLIGFLMLLGVIIGCYRIPALKSPFGKLMVNQNVTQLIACTNSGLFFLLGVVFDLPSILEHSNYAGNISVCLLPLILGSFFFMSANRFCASAFPFSYNRIFNRKKTLIILIAVHWMISLCIGGYLFGTRHCNFRFYHFGWFFTEDVRNETCGSLLVFYAMIVQIVMSVLIFVLDLITLVILIGFRSKIYQAHQSTEVRRREINFAMQVLLQGAVFVMHGFWYDMGYAWIPGNSEQWKIFFTTSFSSNLLHIFDPLIVFAFNREFRKWLFSRKQKHKITMVSSGAAR